ncbi:sigma-70 family RNA polymerase sigma factor [Paenibacillus spiritus]|uniref:Sigma-70 family RNA polymerase sigma factor n=1 Tax=Paenibacillus spiritus TaxID=2496557 RepID=A0A5J5G903_9BACL|nr:MULTISPECIES: RNA polymerase sigma factor [Paenibacillus]KAA9004024.1 sigma-70 family RNA polymerase sigma factor [Paenibacillus spiritus]
MESLIQIQAPSLSEEEEFFRQVGEHRRTLYGIAYSYLRSESDALEMLQEATCRAWIKRGSLREAERMGPWLIRIVINCCNDELKRRKRSRSAGYRSPAENGVAEMSSDARLDMERALEGISPKYRQVLVLKYYRDMTVAEIAAVLEKPEGTVKTWLNKGLAGMRRRLGNRRDQDDV